MLKTLRLGDVGIEVSALRGLLSLSDGDTFDTEVLDKVYAGQKKCNLTIDGIVGPSTWAALAKTLPTLKSGSSGSTVRGLQYLLNGTTADGKFGSKTKSAVNTFQSSVGLTNDGIVGSKTWNVLITGSKESAPIVSDPGSTSPPSQPGQFIQPKDYKQGASPWGPKMYSSRNDKKQTYANSACGPTSMANIVYTCRDKNVTPETLGKIAVAKGYRTANSGTAWSFFKYIAGEYKFKKFAQTTSLATLKAALNEGAYAVASMGPGYWTKGGHFITIYKYDDIYIYANDPASSTRKKQETSKFMKAVKQFFIFWP